MPKRSAPKVTAPPLPESLSAAQRERRERIIEAGLALLRTHDHTQIQMKDVAGEAGVALGTVYRYFQSKDHLFAEVLAHWAARLQTNVARRPLKGTTNAERLTDVLHRSMRAFQSWPQLARVVMALESSEDPFTREIFARNMSRNTEVYVAAVQGLPDEVTRDVVSVAASVFDLQLRRWVMGSQSIADVYDRITRAVWIVLEFSERQPASSVA
ncbi:MAG: TetR/AcrR family transcriptional regulator [Actinomycetota bacterium]|nr:TetR/AcrR family transcriptional regulator [Actinomycetota bacterium]